MVAVAVIVRVLAAPARTVDSAHRWNRAESSWADSRPAGRALESGDLIRAIDTTAQVDSRRRPQVCRIVANEEVDDPVLRTRRARELDADFRRPPSPLEWPKFARARAADVQRSVDSIRGVGDPSLHCEVSETELGAPFFSMRAWRPER